MDEHDRALLEDLLAQIAALDTANYAVIHSFERVINEANQRTELSKMGNSVAFLNRLGNVDAAQRELKAMVEKALKAEVHQ